MANEIDRRVTEMQFDNVAFEQKIATTLTSLDKLQKSLDFSNSSKGMGDLQSAAGRMNFAPLTDAVEGIAGKFSAMGLVAITTLTNITNKAVDAGVNLAKSLSVKPIMEGFREYEVNMGSIQTILANTKDKGGNLEGVNKALDQLNEYSDKTIYNFGQMAKNIGTFTAAGVGLDESVKGIKGISNLAAISGSTSEQASTAMYQLSQALSAGKVNLMDWNSVVNAGMGGEVFKKALFETGKAMKTITDVPLGASFEEWEKQGGTFREQMQNGWLTADVLSTTLQGFSGDLDQAGLKALGFGDAAAKKLVELGQLGQAAATEVKTMSQLMSTLREGVASGWSQSFRTIIGDFEQSKKLFTAVNAAVGGALNHAAEARNKLLKDWAASGGRDMVIESLKDLVNVFSMITNTIKGAFREIFPPVTVITLMEMTRALSSFAEGLRIVTYAYLPQLKAIFKGVFATLEIGWTIVKETAKLFRDVFKTFMPDDGGNSILDFLVKLANFMTNLNEKLVAGGGIRDFFNKLFSAITHPLTFIENLVSGFDGLSSVFDKLRNTGISLDPVLERVESRFGKMNEHVQKAKDIWESFSDVMSKIGAVLEKVWNYISDWFSTLGEKLKAVLQPGDFDAAVDVVNIGLLGGLILVLKKFFDKVLALDFKGSFMDKIGNVMDILTEKASLMQTSIKADILQKIAIAIGILAASMLVLSMIDSAALTKALLAIGTAFLLMSTALDRIKDLATTKTQIAGMVAASGAMIALSTAILILSAAVKVMASMSLDEMMRGLLGVTTMLIALTAASNLIATNSKGMISAAIALTGLAVALTVVSAAVIAFGSMDMDVMKQGLLGISLALVALVAAVNLLPAARMLAAGLAMIPLATGISILAGAVKLFGMLSWEEMKQGMIGMAIAMGIIAVAMHAMPLTLPITAAGLVLVAGALVIMAGALKLMGSMSLEELIHGLGALAGMMLILSLGLIAMTGTLAGAAALVVAAGALVILAQVLKVLGGMSIKEILTGLGALAGTLVVLGVAAALLMPVIPALHALALALALIGGAFALFGVGVMLIAKGFEILAESGAAGAKAFVEMLKVMIKALPEFIGAFFTAIAEFSKELGAALGLIVRTVVVLVGHILDGIVELAPKIAKTLVVVIYSALDALQKLVPRFIEFGFGLLEALMRGWADNISLLTNLAITIIENFARTMKERAGDLVDAALGLLFAFLNAIADRSSDIVAAGLGLLVSLIDGVSDNLNKVVESVGMLIATFIWTAGTYANQIVRVGADLIISIIEGIGSNGLRIVEAGVNTILAFLAGLGANAVALADGAAKVLIQFLDGMTKAIEDNDDKIRESALKLAAAIISGLTGGLVSKENLDKVVESAKGLAGKLLEGFKSIIPFNSPSPLFIQIGKWIGEGAAIGLDSDTTAELAAERSAERIVSAFSKTLDRIPDALGDMREFNPTIVPVLDLSRVTAGAQGIKGLLGANGISPELSFQQAHIISAETLDTEPSSEIESGSSELTFVQNNYSPKALSTNDIYRKTKSQIALVKEELDIK